MYQGHLINSEHKNKNLVDITPTRRINKKSPYTACNANTHTGLLYVKLPTPVLSVSGKGFKPVRLISAESSPVFMFANIIAPWRQIVNIRLPLPFALWQSIIKTKGEQTVEEGCLSFPNKFAKIVRPKEVTVRALNEKGNKIEIKAKDLLAQAISHEVDHLNGELFIDKIIPGTLEIVTPEKKD